MSAKLFQESDTWGDSSGDMGWSFKKIAKVKNGNKEKKPKKRNHSAIEEDPNAGKFVRAPKFYGLEDFDDELQESSAKDRNSKLKRKHDEVHNNGQSSDGITPQKKLKKQVDKQQGDSIASYEDKLRESLKGSRFRFLNEVQLLDQLHKFPTKLMLLILANVQANWRRLNESF